MALSSATSLAADGRSKESFIEAYPARLSYEPGDEVALHVSTTAAKYSVKIARVGAQHKLVWSQDGISGGEHITPANASTHGCRWPVSLKVRVPDDWKSGYYEVTLQATDAEGEPIRGDAFFVVRSGRSGQRARILLQLTTNTYNAYNNWGGPCLYESGPLPLQGVRVSFERPMARGFLTKPKGKHSNWAPYAGWHNWEREFVAWAEAVGYQLDYAVNADLEQRPEILKSYRLVLSVGHDEYWSSPMRDHLEAFIADGGNVAFFSGNVCYWQVRLEDKGNAMVGYKFGYEKDPFYKENRNKLIATLWSNRLIGRPENQLTGVSFNYGGYHRFGSVPRGAGGYTIQRPKHWVFTGTKLEWGDVLGAQHKIVGYECDGCEFVLENGLPVPTHRDGTPAGFEILASAPARLWDSDLEFASKSLFGGTEHKDRFTHGAATMGVYTRGGTVFTTGCTEWPHGLAGKDPLVQQITRNVLDRLSV
ncbi:MAG: hypothetical protein CMJ59_21130 [Planctomycetaceae bacterium]|nr:hypothetical protein [Planctomycetaceae bacterium]